MTISEWTTRCTMSHVQKHPAHSTRLRLAVCLEKIVPTTASFTAKLVCAFTFWVTSYSKPADHCVIRLHATSSLLHPRLLRVPLSPSPSGPHSLGQNPKGWKEQHRGSKHADEPCPWDDSHQLVCAYVVGEDNEDPGMDVRCGMPGRIVCLRRRRRPRMWSTCVSQCIPCYVSTRNTTGLLCTYQTNQEQFGRARHPDYGYIKLRASAVIYCV